MSVILVVKCDRCKKEGLKEGEYWNVNITVSDTKDRGIDTRTGTEQLCEPCFNNVFEKTEKLTVALK